MQPAVIIYAPIVIREDTEMAGMLAIVSMARDSAVTNKAHDPGWGECLLSNEGRFPALTCISALLGTPIRIPSA